MKNFIFSTIAMSTFLSCNKNPTIPDYGGRGTTTTGNLDSKSTASDDIPTLPVVEEEKIELEGVDMLAGYPLRAPLPYASVPQPLTAPINTPNAVGSELHVYRMAIPANPEYIRLAGGIPNAMTAIKAGLAEMNRIFMRDMALRFELIPDNLQLRLMMDARTDPINYTLDPSYENFPRLFTYVNQQIGEANYDVANTLFPNPIDQGSWGGSSPCRPGAKADGTAFNFAAMIHELGHQLSAPHSCYVEGSNGMQGTIMCRSDGNTEYFHPASLKVMNEYVRVKEGVNCGTRTKTSNTPPKPFLAFAKGLTIPKGTPFVLTGGAIDKEDQATLTYTWHQNDTNLPLNTDVFENANAAFRSFFPAQNQYVRYIPNLKDLVSGVATPFEVLPQAKRDLTFSLVVRDNNPVTGGVDWIDVVLKVESAAGPFQITEPQTSVNWQIGSQANIRWDVAATDKAPVNAKLVNILFSPDGGNKFYLIAKDLPNSGSAQIEVPKLPTEAGILMIQAADNIFFNISKGGAITIQE